MKCFYFLLFFFIAALEADVVITTTANTSSLLINQQLVVDVTLVYPKNTPPELFSFLYDLQNSPKTAFEVVSVAVDKPVSDGTATKQVLHITLAPSRTGELIFAPGSIAFASGDYVVPAIGITCGSTELSTLPMAGLLPLYPERRIDLSASNRLAMIDEKVLQKARLQNSQAVARYHLAWDSLAYVIGAVGFGVLILWFIVYYELIDRAKRPKKLVETPLQVLVREVQDKNLARDVRWQKLSCALREALGAKEAQNLHNLGLFELADYVSASSKLSEAEKKLLLPAINTLGGICYAAKPATDEEFDQMRSSMVGWMLGQTKKVSR